MTRYTVVWARDARDQLGDLWLSAPNRNAVTAASYEVDRRLADDAPAQGAELCEGLRAIFIPPLKVIFAVHEDDRIAEVVRVCRFY